MKKQPAISQPAEASQVSCNACGFYVALAGTARCYRTGEPVRTEPFSCRLYLPWVPGMPPAEHLALLRSMEAASWT